MTEEKTRLSEIQKNAFEQAKKEFMAYPLDVNKDLLKDIPKSKWENVIDSAKNEVINTNMKFSQEMLVKLNGPFKDEELDNLKLQGRNLHSQLIWNQTRLKLISDKQTIEENGKVIHSFELKYLIDKLNLELKKIRKHLSYWGLTLEEALKD